MSQQFMTARSGRSLLQTFLTEIAVSEMPKDLYSQSPESSFSEAPFCWMNKRIELQRNIIE
jgi:hypothetical protein